MINSNVQSCFICENENCFLRNLSQDCLSKVDSKKECVSFPKGQSIFKEYDPVSGIYFIKKGRVKVLINGIDDKEQIVRFACDGHILGHRAIGSEKYPISAVAITDSLVCFVDNSMLYVAFMENPKLTFALMMFYSRELRKVEIRMKYLGQMSVREKVAEALLYMHEVFGVNKSDNTLNVELTRQEIADFSGTTADQVIKQCKDFESEKLIVRNKRKIGLVNPLKLEKIVSHFRIHEFFNQQ